MTKHFIEYFFDKNGRVLDIAAIKQRLTTDKNKVNEKMLDLAEIDLPKLFVLSANHKSAYLNLPVANTMMDHSHAIIIGSLPLNILNQIDKHDKLFLKQLSNALTNFAEICSERFFGQERFGERSDEIQLYTRHLKLAIDKLANRKDHPELANFTAIYQESKSYLEGEAYKLEKKSNLLLWEIEEFRDKLRQDIVSQLSSLSKISKTARAAYGMYKEFQKFGGIEHFITSEQCIALQNENTKFAALVAKYVAVNKIKTKLNDQNDTVQQRLVKAEKAFNKKEPIIARDLDSTSQKFIDTLRKIFGKVPFISQLFAKQKNDATYAQFLNQELGNKKSLR